MDDKYVVSDSGLNEAGFSNLSRYDQERNTVLKAMEQYSPKSHTMWEDESGRTHYANPYAKLIILSIFPIAGLHRMLNGKILTGLIFALTVGGCFVWWLIDVVSIISGKFTDGDGLPINMMEMQKLEFKLKELERQHAEGIL